MQADTPYIPEIPHYTPVASFLIDSGTLNISYFMESDDNVIEPDDIFHGEINTKYIKDQLKQHRKEGWNTHLIEQGWIMYIEPINLALATLFVVLPLTYLINKGKLW